MTTKLNITHISSGTSVLGGRKAVIFAPQKLTGMQGLGAKAGLLPKTDTAAPGSLAALTRFMDEQGLETDFGYENGQFTLRVGGFKNDTHLRKLLTSDFLEWYKTQPEAQDSEIQISKDVPILSLDNEPEEKKAQTVESWIYRNSSVLVGVIATVSGIFHFMRGFLDEGKTMPWVVENGKKKFSGEQLWKALKSQDLKQAGSLCFVMGAAFLGILSQKSKQNRSVDEILSDVEERLRQNAPDIALTPETRGSVKQMMDWMVKNPWKVNATLNLVGNVIHTNQNIQNHINGTKYDKYIKDGVSSQLAEKFSGAEVDKDGNTKKMRSMEMLGTVSSAMGLSLILGTPQARAAAFPGLDGYAKAFGDTPLSQTNDRTIANAYEAVDAYPSATVDGKSVKRRGDFVNTLQSKHMEWNAWLSILSNWGYLFDGLFGTDDFLKAVKQKDFGAAKDAVVESFKNKGGALYVAMFTTNTMADILTGISSASFSHAPETIYNDVAKWIDHRFDKDTDPQLLEQFSYQLAFYLASTKEISMDADQISRGVITRLAVKHNRPVNYDRKIAQEYLQLQILSPFTVNDEKVRPLVEQFDKTNRLAVRASEMSFEEARKSPLKSIAEREPNKEHLGRVVQKREEEAGQQKSIS